MLFFAHRFTREEGERVILGTQLWVSFEANALGEYIVCAGIYVAGTQCWAEKSAHRPNEQVHQSVVLSEWMNTTCTSQNTVSTQWMERCFVWPSDTVRGKHTSETKSAEPRVNIEYVEWARYSGTPVGNTDTNDQWPMTPGHTESLSKMHIDNTRSRSWCRNTLARSGV